MPLPSPRVRTSRPRALAALGLVAALTAGGIAGAVALAPSAHPGGPAPSGGAGAGTLPDAPPAQPPPQLTAAQVARAVDRLDGSVREAMRRTGVPGVAVGVVHDGRVLFLKGYGLREVGRPGRVGPDTVFQLASVSKPLTATVVAGAVGDGTVGWDDRVREHDPGFRLKDRWTGDHLTLADLLSHRSGLPDHAGDLLEDLGFGRDHILGRLRYAPLAPFRTSYAYTNFGFTEAALAVARAAGTSWEELARRELLRPLGMTSTGFRFADYVGARDRAAAHVRADGRWQARYVRDADAQSPAGGASSTARDMTKWLLLQLGDGRYDGRRVVDAAALERTWLPHVLDQPPRAPAGRSGFYGLGWNVGYDDRGRLRIGHSGGFDLGAATYAGLLPSERLGLVVLTNGEPTGVPEAIAEDFFDTAQNGGPTVDWPAFFGRLFRRLDEEGRSRTDYDAPPARAAPAAPYDAYTGTYANDYYGPMTVRVRDGALTMELGPGPVRFALRHYAGGTFSYETTGENAVGRSGVTFTLGADGRAGRVRVEHLDADGLGTFTRTAGAAPAGRTPRAGGK
ncbi:serine hydrolase [Streptomyces sp. NPDC059718]